jgi:1-phosphofructokinase
MIATVTLNPAVDKTITVPRFAVGKTNRGRVERVDPGGKGVNVAQALKHLGCPAVASGFLAGNHGRDIAEALAAEGVPTDFIHLPGETRVNLKIIDPVAGAETEINEPGFEVGAEHLARMARKVEELAGRCAVVVFSGSLPPGAPQDTYAALIRVAKSRGARTVLDADAGALRSGMTACPDLIKPNRAEAEEALQASIDGERGLAQAARRLLALGPGAVVISLGAEGSLFASPAGLLRARTPAVKTGSTVGAGDAMVAALAYALLRRLPPGEALRLAAAAGAATATMRGSAVADFQLIRDFLPRVVIEELD